MHRDEHHQGCMIGNRTSCFLRFSLSFSLRMALFATAHCQHQVMLRISCKHGAMHSAARSTHSRMVFVAGLASPCGYSQFLKYPTLTVVTSPSTPMLGTSVVRTTYRRDCRYESDSAMPYLQMFRTFAFFCTRLLASTRSTTRDVGALTAVLKAVCCAN
jgi:hypothetical protein